MRYLLMIYENEKAWEALSEAETGAIMGDYTKFTDDIRASGHMLAGEALQPTATASTVRVRDGKTTVTDGPFAEAKEQLGGFYLVEAKDLDEALRIAARIPGALTGGIEVRPVIDFDGTEAPA
jgi:hypothetical protein